MPQEWWRLVVWGLLRELAVRGFCGRNGGVFLFGGVERAIAVRGFAIGMAACFVRGMFCFSTVLSIGVL